MADDYGSDFLTIADEDGIEYELEILSAVEYNGATYYAVIPAENDCSESLNFEVTILKSIEEDGEPILCTVDDEDELEAVNNLLIDIVYDESDLTE